MKILAIETSCDETAMALLEATETPSGITFTVHANIIHTQVEHQEFGGVFPALAKREHVKNLPIILEQIMHHMNEGVDVICVTSGPGLEPALWTGITFAQELGKKWNVPVIPVNHMEGHILSVLVPEATTPPANARHPFSIEEGSIAEGSGSGDFMVRFKYHKNSLPFPALALLVSGGHTELVLVNAIGDYKIIGHTADDAVGEAFDKVARILGLPYPGGPEIAKLADQYPLRSATAESLSLQGGDSAPTFPRPMIHSKDYNFSFSGLKTAVLYYVRDLGRELTDQDKISIAYEFQEAAVEVLVKKTKKAVNEFLVSSLIVGGGVSANMQLKEKLTSSVDIPVHFPVQKLTGDNALMIALAGYFKYKKNPNKIYLEIKAEGNLLL